MGEAGDLLLVFADALVRSWKQITKFRPASAASSASPSSPGEVTHKAGEGTPFSHPSPQPAPAAAGDGGRPPGEGSSPSTAAAAPPMSLEGLIRDERGIRYAPETED
jgi:cyanophycin synthetase